jgi:membrane protease YdiL (CAAX protease family)
MKKTAWLRLISVAVPYLAVLIGLYAFKNAWIAIGLYHLGIVFFLVVGNRHSLLKKIYKGWEPIMAATGIVVSVMIFFLIFILWKYMQLENVRLDTALVGFGLHGTSWFFFMIYFSTIQPFLEELYWRGYMEFNHKFFSWTDLTFAGYHILVLCLFIKWFWLIIAFIVLTVAAFGFRHIAYKLKGLAVPMLTHIVADISIITLTNALIR